MYMYFLAYFQNIVDSTGCNVLYNELPKGAFIIYGRGGGGDFFPVYSRGGGRGRFFFPSILEGGGTLFFRLIYLSTILAHIFFLK